jgi:tRNA dimethylallyltransferase
MVNPDRNVNLIVITGPTASGKTAFAAQLASQVNGEIISADSRQVYRGMDIGTGKDYEDYTVDGQQIPYHLIDIHDAGYKYNVYEFQKDFLEVFNELRKANKMPVLAGGTGLYIEAVLDTYQLTSVPVNLPLRASLERKSQDELVKILLEMNPTLHNTTDTLHRKRTVRAIEIAEHYKTNPPSGHSFPEIVPVIFGVKYDRQSRRRMITDRLKKRIEQGMIDEVRELLKSTKAEDLIYYGLEYKFITTYLQGAVSRNEMLVKLETAIHQFAKRQMTWFRKMERGGHEIHWLDGHWSMEQKLARAKKILANFQIPV